MPRYRKWPVSFVFDEASRPSLTLGPGVRLHPTHHQLELSSDGIGPDLYARTRVIKPGACRKWAGFEADVTTPEGTSVLYRLSDGVVDRYWNAGANDWIVAAPNHWNTEAEIASHIDAWPSQSLGVVVNLSTTVPGHTSALRKVQLLYETDLVGLEDYVVRSFEAELREKLRPISIYAVRSTGQTTIDLGKLQTPYDVVGVDAVYNNALDPQHMSPLAGWSYAPDTKLLSLPAQPSGHVIEVRFAWRPEVVLNQSQDYTEIAQIPVILFDSVRIENKRRMPRGLRVINKATGHGFAFQEGYQADIRIPLVLFAASARDLHVLSEEASRFFANTRMLRVRGQDEYYPITVETDFDDGRSFASQNEVYSATIEARIRNAIFYPEDARPITAVLRVSVEMAAQQTMLAKEN